MPNTNSGRVVAIASGKGGVGKTSVAVNLGVALAQEGKKTIIVDGDISMASVGIMLGSKRNPVNLHHVLMGEAAVNEATYTAHGVKFVPAGLSVERIKRADHEKLAGVIQELEKSHDFVIVDCAPGIANESLTALKTAHEVILVVNPEPTSLADALKVKAIAEKNNSKLIGIVTNMKVGDRGEIREGELEKLLGCRVLATIPFDEKAKKASTAQIPAVVKFPESDFAEGINRVAAFLCGSLPKTRVKKGIVRSIFESIASVLKRRKG